MKHRKTERKQQGTAITKVREWSQRSLFTSAELRLYKKRRFSPPKPEARNE